MVQRCGQKQETPFAKAFKNCGIGCGGEKKIVLLVAFWSCECFFKMLIMSWLKVVFESVVDYYTF